MKFNFFCLACAFFLDASFTASAAPEDSTKKETQIPTFIRYVSEADLQAGALYFYKLDTTLDNLEIVNPATVWQYDYLANIGSAASPRIYVSSNSLWTGSGFHAYDIYLLRADRIRYFKSNKAYTEIKYHLAGGLEQVVQVKLSQNILKNWNAGIDFERLGSQGFMKNGTTFHTKFDIFTWFHSNNSRYHLFLSSIWNSILNDVNGGLHSDSIYDQSTISNIAMQGLLVNLKNAEQHFRTKQFSLSQYYDVIKKSGDSSATKSFFPGMRFQYSVQLNEQSFMYIDQEPGDYYEHFYVRTAVSADSTHYYDLRNTVCIRSALPDSSLRQNSLSYEIGYAHQWFRFNQFEAAAFHFQDTIMQNSMVTGKIGMTGSDTKPGAMFEGNLVVTGANKNDYSFSGSLNYEPGNFGKITATASGVLKSPDFIYQRYYSNHFIWENNFDKSSEHSLLVSWHVPSWKFLVKAEFITIDKVVYVDSAALPAQADFKTNITKFQIVKDFTLGKIHLNNSIITQHVNRDDVIHLPEISTVNSIYFESLFYRNALLLRAGFDLHYHSSWFSNAFMPATGLFNTQYEIKTGGYPVVDLFINFKIKTARVFLKLENIGDNIADNGYYLVPHYPMQGMTFKLGINWRFFDR